MSNEEISNKDLADLIERTAASTASTLGDLQEELAEVKQDVAKLASKVDSLHNRLDVNAGLDRRVEVLAKDIIEIKEHVGIPA